MATSASFAFHQLPGFHRIRRSCPSCDPFWPCPIAASRSLPILFSGPLFQVIGRVIALLAVYRFFHGKTDFRQAACLCKYIRPRRFAEALKLQRVLADQPVFATTCASARLRARCIRRAAVLQADDHQPAHLGGTWLSYVSCCPMHNTTTPPPPEYPCRQAAARQFRQVQAAVWRWLGRLLPRCCSRYDANCAEGRRLWWRGRWLWLTDIQRGCQRSWHLAQPAPGAGSSAVACLFRVPIYGSSAKCA